MTTIFTSFPCNNIAYKELTKNRPGTSVGYAEESIDHQLHAGERLELVRQDIAEACENAGISVAFFRSGSRSGTLPALSKESRRKVYQCVWTVNGRDRKADGSDDKRSEFYDTKKIMS